LRNLRLAQRSSEVAFAGHRAEPGPREEHVIVHSRLDSLHLAGNLLGHPSERDVFVYPPPGYEASDRDLDVRSARATPHGRGPFLDG
jgi:hypothetical protein